MDQTPIFIHSLFRSGSTYWYHVFERANEPKYYCYQEPLNEAVYRLRDSPETFSDFASTKKLATSLNHPKLVRGYYASIQEQHSAWKDIITEDVSYGEAFNSTKPKHTIDFLKALIGAAPHRCLIQECRSAWRAEGLKSALGGTHIHLWRNPRDQWWSFRSTDYFLNAARMFLFAPNLPIILEKVANEIGEDISLIQTTEERFAYFKANPLSPQQTYLLFYTLWKLAMIEARAWADISINMDELSASQDIRGSTLLALAELGLTGLHLDDCEIAIRTFTRQEQTFFRKIETKVDEWFATAGYHRDTLALVDSERNRCKPKRPSYAGKSGQLYLETSRLRQYALSLEERLVGFKADIEFVHADKHRKHTEKLQAFKVEQEHLNGMLEKLQHECDSLSGSKLELEHEATSLRDQNQEISSKLSEKEAQLVDLSERQSTTENELIDKQETIHSLEIREEELSTEVSSLSDSLQQHKHEIDLLKLKLSTAEDSLGTKVQEISALRQDHSRLSSRASELEAANVFLESKIDVQVTLLRKSEKEVANLLGDIQRSDALLKQQQERLLHKAGLLDSLSLTNFDLTEERKKLTAKVDQVQLELQEAMVELELIEVEKQDLHGIIDGLKSDAHRAHALLLNQQERLIASEQKVIFAEHQNEALAQEQISSLQSQIASAEWVAQQNALKAEKMQEEVLALKQSTSWRISTPLRVASRALRASWRLLVIAPIRYLLTVGLGLVRNLPFMKKAVHRMAGIAPQFRERLVHFAAARPGPSRDE